MLSLDGIPHTSHLCPASNTMLGISNSVFEGSLYGMSMLSLILAIWGICRTLGGPAFEPLISKVSE